MGAIGQAPQSADPELPTVPAPASAAGRLPTKLPAQPTIKAQAPAAPAGPSKPTYTFAFPVSAQPTAVPRRASPPAASPVASNRSSAHIPPNPNDAGRFNVRPGATNEVADIREAIRRSLDRSEDVQVERGRASRARRSLLLLLQLFLLKRRLRRKRDTSFQGLQSKPRLSQPRRSLLLLKRLLPPLLK
ncbi:hypothetical protein DL93DRAFT_766820 [Clavulina sp. PMI_390]|nr:hypothetical protein DL93DRAFT_766820 [Clavulina sp. PMI_390]